MNIISEYSQTCVQRPPLRPSKVTIDYLSFLRAFFLNFENKILKGVCYKQLVAIQRWSLVHVSGLENVITLLPKESR
jgi:hypothetical protein